jgi:hypothetical protein
MRQQHVQKQRHVQDVVEQQVLNLDITIPQQHVRKKQHVQDVVEQQVPMQHTRSNLSVISVNGVERKCNNFVPFNTI